MYYLYHIRKTGGRSIIHSFLALATADPEAFYERLARQPSNRLKKNGKMFVGWDVSTLKRGGFFFAFSHVPAHTFKLPPKAKTITCIRHPLARLKSYYNYIMSIKSAVRENPKHVHAHMPDLAWAYDNPIKFLNKAPRKHLLNQLFMFSKQMRPKEAADVISKVDTVLLTEDIETGIKHLAEKAGLPLEPLHFGATTVKRELSNEFIDKAKKILEPEFEMGRYLKDRNIL